MSMLENLKKVEAEHDLGGGQSFKVQNGDNIVRVLTEGVFHESEYKDPKTGKVSVTKKFVMFLIDRKDAKVKPYFAPYTVYKQIASLEVSPFYKFEGMPMPYDINIQVENAGTMNAEYNIQASPNRTELTAEEIAAAQKAGSVTDYVRKLAEKDAPQNEAPFPTEEHPQTPADVVAAQSASKEAPPDFLK